MNRFALLATLAACAGVAAADTRRDEDQNIMDLARVCVHEAGWNGHADCAAIHAVIVDRAARMRMSYRSALRAYAGHALDRRRVDARAWVPWLDDTAKAPRHWPAHVSWARHRERWRLVVEVSAMAYAGAREHTCDEYPHHWAADTHAMRERAARNGLSRVACVGTHNAFYVRGKP